MERRRSGSAASAECGRTGVDEPAQRRRAEVEGSAAKQSNRWFATRESDISRTRLLPKSFITDNDNKTGRPEFWYKPFHEYKIAFKLSKWGERKTVEGAREPGRLAVEVL